MCSAAENLDLQSEAAEGTSGWKSQGLPNLIARVAGRDRIAGGGECKCNTTQHNATASAAARQYFSPSLVGLILQLPQPTPTDTYKGHNDGQKQRAMFFLLPTLPSCYVTSVMVNCHL